MAKKSKSQKLRRRISATKRPTRNDYGGGMSMPTYERSANDEQADRMSRRQENSMSALGAPVGMMAPEEEEM